jgi:hypothetical protein
MSKRSRDIELLRQNDNDLMFDTGTFFVSIINEVPTLLMILVVILLIGGSTLARAASVLACLRKLA